MIGHVAPEAQVGGPIALVRDGDIIKMDVETRELSVQVSDEELALRPGAVDGPRAQAHGRRNGEVRQAGDLGLKGRRHYLTSSNSDRKRR